jgi:hypothetical protein
VDESVQNGISGCRVLESGVPSGNRKLGDERTGITGLTTLEQLKQPPAILALDRVQEPLIKDEKRNPT